MKFRDTKLTVDFRNFPNVPKIKKSENMAARLQVSKLKSAVCVCVSVCVCSSALQHKELSLKATLTVQILSININSYGKISLP